MPKGCALPAFVTALATARTASSSTSRKVFSIDAHPFAALNTSHLDDGVAIFVTSGAAIETPIHIVTVTGGDGKPVTAHPRVLVVAGANSQVRIAQTFIGAADVGLLQQRGRRSRGRRRRDRRLLHRSARVRARVSRRQHPGARRREGRVRVARVLDRREDPAARHRHRPQGRRRRLHDERRLPRRRRAPDRHAHVARSRDAALHQPRDLQGHPGRQGEGGVQRPHHRPHRRAEDRRQADQPRAAAVGRRDDQLEPAARDLRGRREVHARRGGGAARRRGDVLPAGPRADAHRGARHAAARVCRRSARRPEDSGAARADRDEFLHRAGARRRAATA